MSIRRQWVATLDGRTGIATKLLTDSLKDEDGLVSHSWIVCKVSWRLWRPSGRYSLRCTTIDVVQGLEPTLRRGVILLPARAILQAIGIMTSGRSRD